MSDFKKFIDTKGKSIEEIKKAINQIVRVQAMDDLHNSGADFTADTSNNEIKNTVSEIETGQAVEEYFEKVAEYKRNTAPTPSEQQYSEVQDFKYTSQKIPPRSSLPPRETDKLSEKRDFDYRTMRPVGEPPQLERDNPIAYPHEPLPEYMSEQDEYMLAKIREMRTLEEITRNSYVVRACAEITMVRQGEFMADVEDDFGRRVFCGIPQPIYAAMSNSQLRTYFSWRTDIRRGVYENIDEPYLVLYCYELLNRIGVSSAEDAFRRLSDLWENCSFSQKRQGLFKRWLKDFYAFNRITLPLPFEEQTDNNFSNIAELESGNFSDKLDFLAKNSAYDVMGSAFLNDRNSQLMNGALEAVLSALDRHFRKYDVKLSSLICGKFKKDFSWEPFARAIVDVDRQDGFKAVQISPVERYSVRRGEPVLEHYELSVCRGFVGFILKSIEAKLRRLTNFGKYLNPSIKMLKSDIANLEKVEAAVDAPEFADIIPDTVEQYCRREGICIPEKPAAKKPLKPWDEQASAEPVVVNVDISKLEEIRKLADENTRKLIIDVELTQENADSEPEASAEEDYEDIAQHIHDDEFSDSVADYAQLAPSDEENAAPDFLDDNGFENLAEEWQTLAKNLTIDNIRFLGSMLSGTVREFCREHDILPQMMTEEINAESLLAIDDVIIENGEVLEDYAEEVKAIVSLLKL